MHLCIIETYDEYYDVVKILINFNGKSLINRVKQKNIKRKITAVSKTVHSVTKKMQQDEYVVTATSSSNKIVT